MSSTKKSSMRAFLLRLAHEPEQTIGQLVLYNEIVPLWSCYTLELPWRNNQRNVSCIPAGQYFVGHRESERFGHHLHIKNIPGRMWCLFHAGNFSRQVQGCVLVGRSVLDIDGDGLRDVVDSKRTLRMLVEMVPDEFLLTVVD